jgi:hypothetical protein
MPAYPLRRMIAVPGDDRHEPAPRAPAPSAEGASAPDVCSGADSGSEFGSPGPPEPTNPWHDQAIRGRSSGGPDDGQGSY